MFDNCTAISSLGSYDLLHKANYYARLNNNFQSDLFNAELVGIHSKKIAEVNGISVNVHNIINEVKETDLLIIPGIDDLIEETIDNNKKCLDWIRNIYYRGADVASICTGAFILAETGLADNKTMTTHWIAEDLFKIRYPGVKLAINKIIVDEGQICSSGGATSFMNLMLYLIEKYGSKELSNFCSKVFLVDKNKSSQNSYAIFSTQKNHSDENILKTQQFIEKNYSESINIDSLSEIAFTSKRNFIRRFKKATGNTPKEYIQRVRIEAAKRNLEATSSTILEIIDQVGYEDYSSFRKLFLRYTGLSMSKYRLKYQNSF